MAPHKLTTKQRAERRAKQHADREALTQYTNDNQVLTIAQWCALNSFSVPTGKRVIASGEGPPVVLLESTRSRHATLPASIRSSPKPKRSFSAM
jgi:hypothetical protein